MRRPRSPLMPVTRCGRRCAGSAATYVRASTCATAPWAHCGCDRCWLRRRISTNPVRRWGLACDAIVKERAVSPDPLGARMHQDETYELFQRGRAHLQRGDNAQATVSLEKAKRREPDKASIPGAPGPGFLRLDPPPEGAGGVGDIP